MASPCPAPSRSSFHPAGCGGCWPTCGAGRAVPGPSPIAEAAFFLSAQTDSVASAPTSKPSSSSPPRDSLTPGPGPSSAIPLRPLPAKAPTTDTVSECPGTAWECCSAVTAPWGWDGGRQDTVCHQQSWQGHFAPQNQTYQPWPTGALPLSRLPDGLRPAEGGGRGGGRGFICFSLMSCHCCTKLEASGLGCGGWRGWLCSHQVPLSPG